MSAAIVAAQTARGPSSVSGIFDNPLATSDRPSKHRSALLHDRPLSLRRRIDHPHCAGQQWHATATAKFTFFDQRGLSTSVPLEGSGLKSSQTVTVGANQTKVVGSELSQRTSAGQVAWATMTSTVPLNVFSLFDFGPNPPTINWAVGAQSTAPSKSFRFPVSIGGPLNYNAGMALSNPNGAQTVVTVKVMKSDGTSLGSFQETLAEKRANRFPFESACRFEFRTAHPFNGSVAVCAPQAVGLVALGAEGGAPVSSRSRSRPILALKRAI